MDVLHTIEKGPFRVEVYLDMNVESSRDWDNLGTMACFHGRYVLGDNDLGFKQSDFRSWDGMEKYLIEERKARIILPLFLLDHSGLRMKVGSFHDPWDSGQVGYIFVTADKIRKEYGVKRITKRVLALAEKCLRAEVETYDDFLSGSVYGIVLKKGDEIKDSCWGFFGWKYTEQEAERWLAEALGGAWKEAGECLPE